MDNESLTVATILPDGDSWQPCPTLLTEAEAIRYLRLDKQKANPVNTLKYYRDKKKLKATIIGKNRLYSRKELDSFIDVLTN